MAFAGPRMSTAAHTTPRNSPHIRQAVTAKPLPVRGTRNEQILNLKQVIGTTATSNNGFDCHENGKVFAFTAGTGAVVASLEDDQKVSQRFFRARPAATPLNSTPSIYDSPTPLGATQATRGRTAASLRDGAFGSGSPMNDYVNSPTSRSVARTKASTCVALSPDGKLLAIGETGHKPRVLIFSAAKDAPTDVPLTALSEHTFGVRCLAFSPDSQFLASLGDVNDGFLYIWNVNSRTGAATLHASNKCTSSIRQITWMGSTLVTVGTRHVKVWRLDDPLSGKLSPSKRVSDMNFATASPTASRALFGRNCLLGALLDKTFTSIAAMSSSRALVGSEQGDICLLDDNENPPKFIKIADAGLSIGSIAINPQMFAVIAGTRGQTKLLNLDAIQDKEPETELSDVKLLAQRNAPSQINAMAFLGERLVTVDSQRSLRISEPIMGADDHVAYSVEHCFPAHGTAVLGIHAFAARDSDQASFLTWSADGTVLFWNASGVCRSNLTVGIAKISQRDVDWSNELKVVRAFNNGDLLVSGDKSGVIKILELANGKTLFSTQAHTSDITDLATCESRGAVLVASSGRDRKVQLFRWRLGVCEHLQTLEEHTAAVTGLRFTSTGDRLISCSADRSIIIMDAIFRDKQSSSIAGFLSCRPLTLKASPASMDLIDDDTLLVTALDRSVNYFDLGTGNLTSTFKASDQEGGDAVVLSSAVHLTAANKPSALVAGVSGTDKSIRIYDGIGRLQDREYGHTEGMTGIAAADSHEGRILVTVATDGTIFVWDTSSSGNPSSDDELSDLVSSMDISAGTPRTSQSPTNKPALRKVLSSCELNRLKSLQEEPQGLPDGMEVSQESPRARSPLSKGSPALKKRSSRLALLQTPRLEPTVGVSARRAAQAPIDVAAPASSKSRRSSPAPTTPLTPRVYTGATCASSRPPQSQSPQTSPRPRRRSAGSGSPAGGSIPSGNSSLFSTNEAICRSLHNYRKKLAASSEVLPLEGVRELERELSLTAKALAEKSKRSETAVAKLLDQYSERMVELLEGRIEKSVARHVQSKTSAVSVGATAVAAADDATFTHIVAATDKASLRAAVAEPDAATESVRPQESIHVADA